MASWGTGFIKTDGVLELFIEAFEEVTAVPQVRKGVFNPVVNAFKSSAETVGPDLSVAARL